MCLIAHILFLRTPMDAVLCMVDKFIWHPRGGLNLELQKKLFFCQCGLSSLIRYPFQKIKTLVFHQVFLIYLSFGSE
jgi:hypothetical protein